MLIMLMSIEIHVVHARETVLSLRADKSHTRQDAPSQGVQYIGLLDPMNKQAATSHGRLCLRRTDREFVAFFSETGSFVIFLCLIIDVSGINFLVLSVNLIPVPLSLTSLLMLLPHLLTLSAYHSHHP